MTYRLDVSPEDVNLISDGLGELQAKRVLALIGRLQAQINQQNEAATAAKSAPPVKPAPIPRTKKTRKGPTPA